MWVSRIVTKNYRCFANKQHIDLSRHVNIFIGPNSSGKSSLLRLFTELENNVLSAGDAANPNGQVSISLTLSNISRARAPQYRDFTKLAAAGDPVLVVQSNPNATMNKDIMFGQTKHVKPAVAQPARIPENLIFPHLAARRTNAYNEQINIERTNTVSTNYENLYSKIDSLLTGKPNRRELFRERCQEILGIDISSFQTSGGKTVGIEIGPDRNIRLPTMGDGAPNVLGLLSDLQMAENSIFLIEEPENDLHPSALRKLLRLVIESASNNQFIVTTHSNVVLRELGAHPDCRIFQLKPDLSQLPPTSEVCAVGKEPSSRLEVLRDLGYDAADLYLHSAWLILEESSAERIIREYLVPWFVPDLAGKLRTIAASGVDDVEPRFANFDRIFLFAHLEPVYGNRAWVVVDGDDKGQEIVSHLKNDYSSWPENHFIALSKADFEFYYPDHFQNAVADVLAINDQQERRAHKKQLLDSLIEWLDSDTDQAKSALQESMKEIIDILQNIQTAIST